MLRLYASLTPAQRERALASAAKRASLRPDLLEARLLSDWSVVGRPKQQPPTGDWTYWLLLAGRGFGKSLTGAQWAKRKALENPGCRIALVAPTLGDGRTMVEGETGLLNTMPDSLLRGGSRPTAWNRSLLELNLANKSQFKVFSSEKPDRLRAGGNTHFAWCEELSSWKDARLGDKLETTWSNLKLGCRLGEHPQFCITTTPKANKLTKEILGIGSGLAVVRGSSYENRDNLSEAWWREVVTPYEGTRLGRQEIHAELLEDVEGALWTRGQLDALRVATYPDLARIIVAVDPNVSSEQAANDAGVIVAGRGAPPVEAVRAALGRREQHGYVLADRTITVGGPRAWARAAVEAYHEFDADRIVAEKNNGGEMVELTIKTVDPKVPVKLVSASRGKRTRAEPIASLYEGDEDKGNPPRVHHVGAFPELEDEMTTWVPDPGVESPNRMDALVWALSELMLRPAMSAVSSVPRGTISSVPYRQTVPRGIR